ncbi:Uncharacterised protein [uncultured archaeon]|nr:Uncharacterised protein [uncultured archaeon]
MRLDEKNVAVAASIFAIAGIALLLFMSETAQTASIARSLVSEPNTLLIVSGTAANVTAAKFSLCDKVCVSIRADDIPTAALLSNGREVTVTGRMKEYQNNRYIEAEKIEVK